MCDYVLSCRRKGFESQSNSSENQIMVVCRKCGKEIQEEEVSHEYHMDHRRGKVESDKICSECN